MCAPVGVPVGACVCLWVPVCARWLPLSPLGSLIIPQLAIDILRVLVVYWLFYQCFFELSTGYPQSYPQVSLGLIWLVYQCFLKLSTGYPQSYPQGSLGLIWLVYKCFFKLSTGYPQSYPQGSLGLIWVVYQCFFKLYTGVSTGVFRFNLGQYGV